MISAELKAKAREMYFRYELPGAIAEQLGLKIRSLENWIFGRDGSPKEKTWKWQREQKCQELMESVYDDEVKRNTAMLFRLGMPLLVRSLEFRAKLDMPLNLEEAQALSGILTSFDKLRRLDAGQPTDIGAVKVQPLTLKELQDIIVKDKFFDLTKHVAELPPPVKDPMA